MQAEEEDCERGDGGGAGEQWRWRSMSSGGRS